MNETERSHLLVSLVGILEEWWASEDVDGLSRPYVGDDVLHMMAQAALLVLYAVDNTQSYLVGQGMLDV